MRLVRATTLATLAGLAALATSASANPIDQYGFGSRSAAMAGAAAADGHNGVAANYYNPGALVASGRMSLDVGYMYNHHALAINGLDQHVSDSSGFVAGIVVPGQIGGLKLAVGAAVHLPDERATRSRQILFSKPRWALFDNRPQRFMLSTNVAVQLKPGLSIGGGVSYMSRTEGVIRLRGLVGFPLPQDSDLELATDVDLVAVRYPQAGIYWEPTRDLALGLTYRHTFLLQVHQGFRVEGDVGTPGTAPIIRDGFFQLISDSRDLFQPTQVALGAEYHPIKKLRVNLDATYQRWSTFRDPAADIRIDLDLKDLQSLVKLPPPRVFGPAGFHDTLVVRTGVELGVMQRRRMSMVVRGGYAFEPTPVPEQSGETNFVDCDKHTIAAGAGLRLWGLTAVLPRPFDIDLHLAATILPERLTRKWSPVDTTGDYRAGGVLWQAGLMTRLEF